MTVPAKLFQQWLNSVAGDTSQAALCRAAGIKRSTLAQQLVRGRVSVATVAAVSRSLGLPVVGTLTSFPTFSDLQSGIKLPTQAEVLSQVSDVELLQEILLRNAGAPPRSSYHPSVRAGQASTMHRASVRAWFDAVDTPDLRQNVAKRANIAPQNLSAQITANRLTAALAVDSARVSGVGLTNGLVATGLLSPEEAGWPPTAREETLSSVPDSALVLLTAQRLETLGKTLRRNEEDSAAVQSVWENLA